MIHGLQQKNISKIICANNFSSQMSAHWFHDIFHIFFSLFEKAKLNAAQSKEYQITTDWNNNDKKLRVFEYQYEQR